MFFLFSCLAMAMVAMACCRSSSSLLRSLLCIRAPPRSSPTFFTFSSSHATRLLTSTPGLASGSCNPASVHKNFCELRGRVRDLSLGFTSRAGSGSSPGAIDSPLISSMQAKIKEQLNAEVVLVIDTSGDGRHVSIDVVATAFEGKSAVNRQRMVYKAIWEELKEVVHAVDQLRTRTPQEVADAKSQL